MFCHKGTGLRKDTPANIECSEVQTPFVDIFHAGWPSFHARETQGTHTIIGRRPKPLVSQAFPRIILPQDWKVAHEKEYRLKRGDASRATYPQSAHGYIRQTDKKAHCSDGVWIPGSYDYKEPNSLAADFAVALIEFAFPCLLSCAVSNSPLLQTSQWRPWIDLTPGRATFISPISSLTPSFLLHTQSWHHLQRSRMT